MQKNINIIIIHKKINLKDHFTVPRLVEMEIGLGRKIGVSQNRIRQNWRKHCTCRLISLNLLIIQLNSSKTLQAFIKIIPKALPFHFILSLPGLLADTNIHNSLCFTFTHIKIDDNSFHSTTHTSPLDSLPLSRPFFTLVSVHTRHSSTHSSKLTFTFPFNFCFTPQSSILNHFCHSDQ